jgi:hypothetical protein
MAKPEHPGNSDQTGGASNLARLCALNRQLELADAIENPIERIMKRESLLEQIDELDTESGGLIDEA